VLTPPFAITGANAADFGVGAPATTTVDGGASTTVPVAFQPLSAGVKSASLLITTSTGTTRTVALAGVGTCPAIVVSGTLPNGVIGVPYSGSVTASGGDAPFTFAVASGAAPSGLTLAAGGALAGTPTATGSFTFTVQATSANGCTGTASFTVAITPPPIVLTASPSTLDFGIVPAGTSATQTVTLRNASATPIVLTTTPIVTGADAARFSVGAPARLTLAPGATTTTSIGFSPTAGGVRTATVTVSTTGGASTSVALTGIGSVATPVVISEFRTHGPSAGNDEFVEIYNNTDAPIDISSWQLRGSSNAAPTNPTPRASVPASVLLPARAHFLFVNTGAYTGPVPGNVGYTTGIADNGGIALTDATGTIIDQVGVTTTGTAYREGNPLTVQLTTNVDRSYARKAGSTPGSLQDTDDNATDFALVTPSDPQDLVFNATPTRVDFGSAPTGDMRPATVTIKNLLLSPLTLTTTTVGGADAASFDAGPLASTTVAGGSATTLPVVFHPTAVGSFNAQVTVDSDHGTVSVDLTGAGTPGIVVTPTAIDFGSVEPGIAASALVTIANGEPIDVTLSPPFAITGSDAAAFSAGAPGTTLLAAGDSTTTPVAFTTTSLCA